MGPLDCCGLCFSGKAALQHHTEAYHIPKYECSLCDRRFHSPSHLQRHHVCVHSDLKEFKCNLCDYATSQKSHLKKHMERKNHRTESDEEWLIKRGQRHKCEICCRTFPYPSRLRYHMTFAHGEQKPFKCSRCEYTTVRKSHLKRHLELHESKDKSTSNNESVDSSSASTNVNCTDACDPPREEKDVERNTVDRPLRKLRSTVQNRTVNRENSESPVVEKKRSNRKTAEEESEDSAPSYTSINNVVDNSSHHSENVESVEMRKNLISSTSSDDHPPSQRFSLLPVLATPIHEEARKLKSEVLLATTLPVVLSLLERLLDLSASIMHQIRISIEVEVRHKAIECFEYVWSASKIAVGRWRDMVETSMDRNTFLRAVQYAYKILPVFFSLEINEHLEMVENVMLLALNTVKNCQHPSSTGEF
ncbi:myoneurin-like isoform X1 [Daphnia pulex]|uniref:myoneurin-like isoform X1 n=1 Tax=Daphnia pulex TaxID=6669 RepID=UPI001EDD354F|nr:myoneurin-like isoform X1 [Daphnia pulex]